MADIRQIAIFFRTGELWTNRECLSHELRLPFWSMMSIHPFSMATVLARLLLLYSKRQGLASSSLSNTKTILQACTYHFLRFEVDNFLWARHQILSWEFDTTGILIIKESQVRSWSEPWLTLSHCVSDNIHDARSPFDLAWDQIFGTFRLSIDKDAIFCCCDW